MVVWVSSTMKYIVLTYTSSLVFAYFITFHFPPCCVLQFYFIYMSCFITRNSWSSIYNIVDVKMTTSIYLFSNEWSCIIWCIFSLAIQIQLIYPSMDNGFFIFNIFYSINNYKKFRNLYAAQLHPRFIFFSFKYLKNFLKLKIV